MQIKALETYLDTFMCAESDFPFGPEALVFKIKGKMFAILAQREGRDYVSVKVKPEDGEVLTSQFTDITPGYHLNKKTLGHGVFQWRCRGWTYPGFM